MNDIVNPGPMAKGQIDGFLVRRHKSSSRENMTSTKSIVFGVRLPGWWEHVCTHHNDFLYEWGAIVQNLLRGSPDGKSYNIGGIYFEFDNSGSPVSPTLTVNRDESLNYYNDLNSAEPARDYLRIPLLASEQDSSDPVLYPKNNIARFIAQTAGTTGVHGLTYSDGSNSRVYGGALVAFLDEQDSSQDIILSRFYLPGANQILKPAGSQIGVTWSTTFI